MKKQVHAWQRQRHFSAWEFVGNDVLKVIGRPPEHLEAISNELVAVMVVAIAPSALAEALKNEKAAELARVFAHFYEAEPDLALRLLSVIRGKWNDQSVTARVGRHLLTKAYHQRPIVKENKWVQQGIFHKDAKATDVQTAIIGAKQKLKGIAEAEAVKKARQRVRPPPWRPMISPELNSALLELRTRGFDVGLGW